MKLTIIICLLAGNCFAQTNIPIDYRDKIVNAIYIVEGGAKTKYPFGIKSIDTKGNKEYAKKICENTVHNNFVRYNNLSDKEKQKYHCYLDFLAFRYCPPKSDPVGHTNWVKNIHILVNSK